MANSTPKKDLETVSDEKPSEAEVEKMEKSTVENGEKTPNKNGHLSDGEAEVKEGDETKEEEKKSPKKSPQKSAKKTPKAEKEEKEENKEGEEDDESSDEELELGLLEKPIEILTNKRDRKSTERFETSAKKDEEKKDEPDYSKGKGTKLGDIEFVRKSLMKADTEDLTVLHRMLYRRKGKTAMIKKNIYAFCGFPYDKDDALFKSTQSIIERLTVSGIKYNCELLGVDKSNDKEQMQKDLTEFLFEPKDLGKKWPVYKHTPKTKKKTQKKRKSRSTPKRASKEKKVQNGDDSEEVSSASDDSDSEDEEEATQKTPKAKSSTKKPASEKKSATKSASKSGSAKKGSKPTPVKIAVPKGRKSKTPKRKVDSSSSSEDDEPLKKKTKANPTNAELKKAVSAILKDADLEEVTMKTVVRQVYDRYPSHDLTSKKDYIKSVVKELIS